MVNPYVLCIGWTLVHFLWQGAVVALLLWIALRLLAKKDAKVRYGLCCLALVTLAMCPVATYLSEYAKSQEDLMRPVVVVPVSPKSSLATNPSPYSTEVKRFFLDPYLPTVVSVWALGVALFTLRLLGGLLVVERLKKRFTSVAPPELQDRLNHLASRLNIRRNINLTLSQRVESPMTVGVFRSIVILPFCLITKLSTEQLEVILLHELAHISRHDYLVNLMQSVLETAMFYHPAVWWISHRVRAEREHCCDDIVIRTVGESALYAKTLTMLEEHRQLSSLAIPATGGSLMNRIRRILGFHVSPVKASTAWATIALLVVMMFAMSATIQAEVKTTPKKKNTKLYSKPIPKKTTKKSSKKSKNPIIIYVKKPTPVLKTIATSTALETRPMPAPGGTLPYIGKEIVTTTAAGMAMNNANHFDLVCKNTPFSEAISSVCKHFNLPFVVKNSDYMPVTIMMNGTDLKTSIKLVCEAGGANYHVEDGVYYFEIPWKGAETRPHPVTKIDDLIINSLEFKNAELPEALILLSKATGRAIMIAKGEYPRLTMTFTNTPFNVALKMIEKATNTKSMIEDDGTIIFNKAN